MDELQQRIESLKVLQDWSKWLIGLEAGVCALLWRVFKESKVLYAAWIMFWLSIIAAAFLLLVISLLVGRREITSQNKKNLWALVAAEYLFFVVGMILVFMRATLLPHGN